MSQGKDKPTQWHPLFAELLRPLLQDYYDVQTDVPVGDLPRQADILLVNRKRDVPMPFRGWLQHLTTWNIIEFKGRNSSARIRHLDLLVEVGLGIDRRQNEERARQKQRALDPAQVSFWYIVNHLGKRFLRQARERLGSVEEISPGVWRSQVLLRPLFLIDGRTVPMEREAVPLHLVGEASQDMDEALAHFIVEEPGYWELYGFLLGALHPNAYAEAFPMAKSKVRKGDLDLRPMIEIVGWKKLLALAEVSDVIESFGPLKLAKELCSERYRASLSAEERQKLKNFADSFGANKKTKEAGMKRYLASLSAEERQQLKDFLQ